MFETDGEPSGIVVMFALSRWVAGPANAAACASPVTGSFWRKASVRPKLLDCAFQLSSVKPSRYDQSCIRLCIVNRFVTAAETSTLWPTTGLGTLQSVVDHSFVHGNV